MLRSSSFLLMPVVLLLVGCSGERNVTAENLAEMAGEDELQETVAVSGVVRLNGEPAGGITIDAYTAASGMEPAATTKTKADGTYQWTKYASGDGLVPGTYRMAFTKLPKKKGRPDPSTDEFQGKYINPLENDFSLTVETEKPQIDVNYELEM
jgi:5-hydroxyisourate hydrolase-like protein (transthyretin family)